jgi:hypothetical protein
MSFNFLGICLILYYLIHIAPSTTECTPKINFTVVSFAVIHSFFFFNELICFYLAYCNNFERKFPFFEVQYAKHLMNAITIKLFHPPRTFGEVQSELENCPELKYLTTPWMYIVMAYRYALLAFMYGFAL